MHKTTIFIIQLCSIVELFGRKDAKRHFRRNFVTSGWVHDKIDFVCWSVSFMVGVILWESHCALPQKLIYGIVKVLVWKFPDI